METVERPEKDQYGWGVDFPYAIVETESGTFGPVMKVVDQYKTREAAERDMERKVADPTLCFTGAVRVVELITQDT